MAAKVTKADALRHRITTPMHLDRDPQLDRVRTPASFTESPHEPGYFVQSLHTQDVVEVCESSRQGRNNGRFPATHVPLRSGRPCSLGRGNAG